MNPLFFDTETKATYRYVRTQEGARKYGVPVGSIIRTGNKRPLKPSQVAQGIASGKWGDPDRIFAQLSKPWLAALKTKFSAAGNTNMAARVQRHMSRSDRSTSSNTPTSSGSGSRSSGSYGSYDNPGLGFTKVPNGPVTGITENSSGTRRFRMRLYKNSDGSYTVKWEIAPPRKKTQRGSHTSTAEAAESTSEAQDTTSNSEAATDDSGGSEGGSVEDGGKDDGKRKYDGPPPTRTFSSYQEAMGWVEDIADEYSVSLPGRSGVKDVWGMDREAYADYLRELNEMEVKELVPVLVRTDLTTLKKVRQDALQQGCLRVFDAVRQEIGDDVREQMTLSF